MSGAKGPYPSLEPSFLGVAPPSRDPSLLTPFGLQMGSTVAGRYSIQGVLGSGGMGVVVLALHTVLRQPVAIKLLRPELSRDGTHVERFLREALAAAQLRTGHVVRVMDADRLPDGTPYLVMEALEGQDLGKVLTARGRLPVAETAYYVLQACEALAEAHARGIVHRDLKPSNLFLTVTPEGLPCVKVLDFGISKIDNTEGDLRLTATSVVLGSPLHMSPEQIRDSRSVDRRTDIWSLGTLTFELLAGQPPFLAETASALIAKISADAPDPIQRFRSDIPYELAAHLARCLEKDRERRIQSVAEFAHGLAPYAPPEAHAHLDRIFRLAQGSSWPRGHDTLNVQTGPGGLGASAPGAQGAAQAASTPGTGAAGHSQSGAGSNSGAVSVVGWGTTRRPAAKPVAPQRRAAIVIFGGTLIGVASTLGWWWTRDDGAVPTSDASASGTGPGGVSASESAPSAPVSPQEPRAKPPEPVHVTPSQSAPPVEAAPAAPPPAAPPPVSRPDAASNAAVARPPAASARHALKKPAPASSARARPLQKPGIFDSRK